MILIKLGGSIIAPKNQDGYINKEYLRKFENIIKKYNTILVHGTGSIGHGFIRKYGLSEQTYPIGRIALDRHFEQIDNIVGYKRIPYTTNRSRSKIKPCSIIGGDITTQPNIISSDTIFAQILAQNNIQTAIIATDVHGVLDQENNIIPIITKDNIDTIPFRSKPGDVTGSMKEKIQQLINHNTLSKKTVRICDGYNLENIEHIIKNGQGIGTQILL